MIYSFIGITTFSIACAFSYFLTRWLQQRAHHSGWLDDPLTERKIHDEATPTAGGLGIAVGVVAGVAALALAGSLLGVTLSLPSGVFWIGAAVMLVTGFVDDLRGASFKKKFFIQSTVAYGLLFFGYGVDVNALLPVAIDAYHATLLSVPLTMVWVVGVMNAVNFIDGLDGLAGGVVLVAIATFGAIFGVQGEWGLLFTAVAVSGAVLGFLRFNVHPATIFMGDSGSLLLGYLAAVFPLVAPLTTHPVVNVLVPVVVLGLPILDTATSIVRRTLSHRSIFAPDSDHIHHRLLLRWPEARAVSGMYVAAGWFGIAALLMVIIPPVWAYGVGVVTAVVAIAWVVRLGYFDAHVPEPLADVIHPFSLGTSSLPVQEKVPSNGSKETALRTDASSETMVPVETEGV
jgi:UDP-GlcNAc:undecaprenyl-phosphate GlcNAc-1-phosphate transferase